MKYQILLNLDNNITKYILGFLATDGNVCYYKDKKNAVITFTSNDIDIITKIKNHIKCNNKIGIKNDGAYRLQICDFRLANKLAEFGIKPNKSKSIFIISEILLNSCDFWRGCIDGDGCIDFNQNKPRVRFCSASLDFITQFKDYVHREIGCDKTIYEDNGLYRITIFNKDAKNLVHKLYLNASIYLDRKYVLAMKIIEE